MKSFQEFISLKEQNTVGTHNDGNRQGGGFMTSDQTGSEGVPGMEGHPLHMPGWDLGLPKVTKTAQIRFIEKTRNPITVQLTDGTRMFFTIDEFKRIKGCEPEVGKTMAVVFQRNPIDKSEAPSKIETIRCY